MLASLRETPNYVCVLLLRIFVDMDEVVPDQHLFGRMFHSQTQMSAQGVPHISAVREPCTADRAHLHDARTSTHEFALRDDRFIADS